MVQDVIHHQYVAHYSSVHFLFHSFIPSSPKASSVQVLFKTFQMDASLQADMVKQIIKGANIPSTVSYNLEAALKYLPASPDTQK